HGVICMHHGQPRDRAKSPKCVLRACYLAGMAWDWKPAATPEEAAKRRQRQIGSQWEGRVRLYSLSGYWAVTAKDKREWRQFRAPPDEPPPPLTAAQAERCARMLERRGWTLVRNYRGELVLCRTI